jgi:DNA polymerase-1
MLWSNWRSQMTTTYHQVFQMEMATRFIISNMEMHGARVDREYSQLQWDKLAAYADQIQAWGKEAFKINLGSNVRLAELLVSEDESIKDIANYTPGQQMQVDKALLHLLSNPENGYSSRLQTIARQVLHMRKSRKYASTYFENFVRGSSDGLVHAEIRTLGARTGRMSIASPAMQQCPKDSALVRNAFIPSEGNVIVTCDYSQIEMRILAELSRDSFLQQAFLSADESGGDFFVEIGRQVYADPSFTKKDKRRNLIKSTMYGKAYGAGPETMAATAGVKVDKMKEVINTLDLNYPGINGFMHQVEVVGRNREVDTGQGFVTTKVGRRLPCDTGRLYTLTNYLIQSTAADVLKQAIIRLDAAGYDRFMVLPVHDEVVLDIPADYAEQALRDVPLIMQELDHPVPFTADADGPFDRWGEKYA